MGSRKLTSEIEKTLKKVEQGLQDFDEIWDRVHDAKNSNQKEKHEVGKKPKNRNRKTFEIESRKKISSQLLSICVCDTG